MRIESAEMGGAQDRGEDLPRLSAASGAIAAADLAGDARPPEQVFGSPVGGVDGRRVEQQREERRPLDAEVRAAKSRTSATGPG